MAASTIAPIAIAIPPSDIIFDVMLKNFINRNPVITASGRVIMITSELLKWKRNIPITIRTIILSSINVLLSVLTAFSISCDLS